MYQPLFPCLHIFMHPCFSFCPYFSVKLPCTPQAPRWIFIHSFPAWHGVCRRLPGTLQHPFPLQHAPGAALAALFSHSGRGIIIIRVFRLPAAHAGMPLIFFLLLLRSLVLSACPCGQIFLREAHLPPSSSGCPGFFVSIKVFSLWMFSHSIKIPAY